MTDFPRTVSHVRAERPRTRGEVQETKRRVDGVIKECEMLYDFVYKATQDARLKAGIRNVLGSAHYATELASDEDVLHHLFTLVHAVARDASWLAKMAGDSYATASDAHYKASVATRQAQLADRRLAELSARFADPIVATAIKVGELLAPHVYIFRDARGDALYVGKSINVLSRLAQHRKRDFYEQAETVELIPCETEREMSELEVELIIRLDPPHNVVGRAAS